MQSYAYTHASACLRQSEIDNTVLNELWFPFVEAN